MIAPPRNLAGVHDLIERVAPTAVLTREGSGDACERTGPRRFPVADAALEHDRRPSSPRGNTDAPLRERY